jgi:hypothetical protein
MSEELQARIEKAHDELSKLCKGKQIRMCIPVQPDDTDMVIGDGLRAGREALKEIEQLRAENVRLRDALKPFADIGDSFDPADEPNAVWVDCARAMSDISGLTLRDFFDASKAVK